MEGIIAIIIIVISLISSANKTKKNAPGQSGETRPSPAQQLREIARQQERERSTSVPQSAPVQETFRQQMSPAPAAPSKPVVKGHQAAGSMSEGSSRGCEHGSLGGSIAYEGHTEGKTVQSVRPSTAPMQTHAVSPAMMSAEEMRRAVIMAEILKRPTERMAEQSRRWGAR